MHINIEAAPAWRETIPQADWKEPSMRREQARIVRGDDTSESVPRVSGRGTTRRKRRLYAASVPQNLGSRSGPRPPRSSGCRPRRRNAAGAGERSV